MLIRKSTPNDLPRMLEIYAFARKFMAEHGNPNQWGPTNWPPVEVLEQDIKDGDSYVCVEAGKVVATFYYTQGKDIEPTYRVIENGNWKGSDTYGVIHRIASDGSVRGIGKFCIDWVYERCGHIRIDTHTDNVVMQSMLEKNGFEKCGIIYVVEDNYPRLAYEKN